jgi:hypothetical protein
MEGKWREMFAGRSKWKKKIFLETSYKSEAIEKRRDIIMFL